MSRHCRSINLLHSVSATANSYNWGVMMALTVGYNATKFWSNVAEYYGAVDSPWTYSINTIDELRAGIQGANDGLFDGNNVCGCRP